MKPVKVKVGGETFTVKPEATAVDQMEILKQGLGYVTFNRPPLVWLKTGSKRLNSVLGSETLGLPYGKLLTLAGKQSSGKTLLAIRLLGKAQQDGAVVGWVDLENSFDPEHAKKQGLDPGEPVLNSDGDTIGYTNLFLFRPEFGRFGKTGRQKAKDRKKNKGKESGEIQLDERQQTAEELFELVKKWMILQRKINPKVKIALGVDSTTAIQPEEELTAGLVDQNMKTRLSLANFLNQLTKDFVSLASNTNGLVILISQLRTNPMKLFANPDYVPGGNGVLFYPSSINWMKRVRNITKNGRNIGLESIIANRKNKMGGGSVEGMECGIRAMYESGNWEFVSVKDILKKDG